MNEIPKRHEIADIACRKEMMSILVSERGCHVYGLDQDKGGMVFAKRINANSNCELQVRNAEVVPFRSGCLDIVICNCALEHFRDNGKVLWEVNRILTACGTPF